MSESKHTPGPWTIGCGGWDEHGNVTYSLYGIKKLRTADARLISAAPDLLEALQAIATWPYAEKTADMGVINMMETARAAIAKATGT